VFAAEESAIKNDASGIQAVFHRTLREFLPGHATALRAKVRIEPILFCLGCSMTGQRLTTPMPRSSGIGGS
jgi:hypothetical protein